MWNVASKHAVLMIPSSWRVTNIAVAGAAPFHLRKRRITSVLRTQSSTEGVSYVGARPTKKLRLPNRPLTQHEHLAIACTTGSCSNNVNEGDTLWSGEVANQGSILGRARVIWETTGLREHEMGEIEIPLGGGVSDTDGFKVGWVWDGTKSE